MSVLCPPLNASKINLKHVSKGVNNYNTRTLLSPCCLFVGDGCRYFLWSTRDNISGGFHDVKMGKKGTMGHHEECQGLSLGPFINSHCLQGGAQIAGEAGRGGEGMKR